MALALFPNGLGHWIMRRAVPMVARDDGKFWQFDYGREKISSNIATPERSRRAAPCINEKIAANLATPTRGRRVGWTVLFSLPEEIDGELMEVFPWVRIAHVFDDADEAEEDI